MSLRTTPITFLTAAVSLLGSETASSEEPIQMVANKALSTSAAPHSAVWLNDKERCFWWDSDYLALIAKRVDFSHVRKALDVGCGKGAWTAVISSLLPKDTEITAVDSDPEWIKEVNASSLPYKFLEADANALPFEDESFDLVTCQTLLIYMLHPEQTLAEMGRVLKPGGLLVLAEPNNVAMLLADSNTVQNSLSFEERMDVARFYCICQEGKKLRGQGFSSIGPQLCYRLPSSITHLHTLASNKLPVLVPPYESEDQRSLLDSMYSMCGEDRFKFWPKELALNHFLAVYPEGKKEFERLWEVAMKSNAIHRQQTENGTLAGVFGAQLLLTIGEKTQKK